MSTTKIKRGPGRPKGSKNKVKSITSTIKCGRGRPKGSKNKVSEVDVDSESYNLPFEKPSTEDERIANIAYMVSFYQTPEGNPKVVIKKPKKRGRKPSADIFDDDALLKQDLDTNKFTYNQEDISEELSRMDSFQDFTSNSSRYIK